MYNCSCNLLILDGTEHEQHAVSDHEPTSDINSSHHSRPEGQPGVRVIQRGYIVGTYTTYTNMSIGEAWCVSLAIICTHIQFAQCH